MIKGLSGATIWSEDLSNLLPFYRDVLGLPVGIETPGFVLLAHAATLALKTPRLAELFPRHRSCEAR